MNEPVAFVGPSLNTAPNASVTADWGEVNDVATESRRRWGRATWFGIATYFAWSPCRIVNQFLPQGSTTRGAVLTLIPLVGVLAVLRLRTAGKRIQIDLLVVLLAVLVIWQVISVERTAGTGYLTHVIPGAALLLLAIVREARSRKCRCRTFDLPFRASWHLCAASLFLDGSHNTRIWCRLLLNPHFASRSMATGFKDWPINPIIGDF